MIPGSISCSDMSASTTIIKKKLREILLNIQHLDTPAQQGWKKSEQWLDENFMSY